MVNVTCPILVRAGGKGVDSRCGGGEGDGNMWQSNYSDWMRLSVDMYNCNFVRLREFSNDVGAMIIMVMLFLTKLVMK